MNITKLFQDLITVFPIWETKVEATAKMSSDGERIEFDGIRMTFRMNLINSEHFTLHRTLSKNIINNISSDEAAKVAFHFIAGELTSAENVYFDMPTCDAGAKILWQKRRMARIAATAEGVTP